MMPKFHIFQQICFLEDSGTTLTHATIRGIEFSSKTPQYWHSKDIGHFFALKIEEQKIHSTKAECQAATGSQFPLTPQYALGSSIFINENDKVQMVPVIAISETATEIWYHYRLAETACVQKANIFITFAAAAADLAERQAAERDKPPVTPRPSPFDDF